jgi:HEAT repeat protein
MPLIRKGPGEGAPPPQSPNAAILLTSGSPDERWTAVRLLSAAPENAARLGEALRSEREKRVREAIFTALARMGTDQAVEIVLPYIRDADAAIRTEALDALCAMPQAALARLPALLSDTDPDVRLLSCEIARHLPAHTATQLLCELLEKEMLPNVCAAAVEVLTEVGEPAALPVLDKCAERFADVSFLAFAIRIAATRIGSGARDAAPS